MNTKQTLLTLAGILTVSTIFNSSPALAWGFSDVGNAVNNAANQAGNAANQAGDTAGHVVDTATQQMNDAAQQAADQVNNASNGGLPSGASVNVDIPNPVRGVVSGVQQAGRDIRQTGNEIGRQAGNAYSNLENTPGASFGFGGSVEVNGRQFGGSHRYNVENPLPGMRHNAETAKDRADAAYNEVAGRADQYGQAAGRKIRDEYNRMENMPGASFGGNVGVNVNGHQYGYEKNIELPNPLRSVREAGQDVYSDMNRRGRDMRRNGREAFNRIENAPGLSISGDFNGRANRNGADANANAGVNPYYGQRPNLRAQVIRRGF